MGGIAIGCGSFIINERDELLLGLRQNASTFNGLWSIPGGGVEPGELLEEAVRRETLEEIGARVEVFDCLGFYQDNQNQVRPGIYFEFLSKIISGVVRNMEPAKCKRIERFSLNNLPKNVTEYTTQAVQSYLKSREKYRGMLGFS
ncbi:MAG: NUDIX hydrolase [Nanoarchaeota archaeon]